VTPLSKNKIRRLARLEKQLASRKDKRKREKERRKEKRRQLVAEGSDQVVEKKPRQLTTMAMSKCKLRVAVDLAHQEVIISSVGRDLFIRNNSIPTENLSTWMRTDSRKRSRNSDIAMQQIDALTTPFSFS